MNGDQPRYKLAFVGSHGVGKTTLCYGVAARLKARDVAVDLVHEVARRCPLPINEGTSFEAQAWILHTQIREEILAAYHYPVVICDRSVLDNFVYLLLAAGRDQALDTLVGSWITTYNLLVHVPIVSLPQDDGQRAVDPSFQRVVDERLEVELDLRGLEVLRLDPEDRSGWIDAVVGRVWQDLRPAQLELL